MTGNGDADPKTSPAVVTATLALDRLAVTDMGALMEAALLASDPSYVLSPRVARVLSDLRLLDGDGNLLDTARDAVLSWQPREGAGDA